MFPINAAVIKAIALLLTVAILAGSIWYITGLRADLAVSEENSKKLADGIAQQQAAIKTIQEDQTKINALNTELTATIKAQNKDLASLNDRFNTKANGEKRNFGATAAVKPAAVERVVNSATALAARCFEIATGAPLTDKEKNAKLPNEINKECPSLANPGYKPATGL
jgi:hypothetical protein|tara:strand:- start:8175 stop:8678 length:504 start_codon:yes stop_codon:yes gene_type:complete